MLDDMTLDTDATRRAVLDALDGMAAETEPFPHFYLRPALPDPLVAFLSSDAGYLYKTMKEQGRAAGEMYPQRLVMTQAKLMDPAETGPAHETWRWIALELFGTAFMARFTARFGQAIMRTLRMCHGPVRSRVLRSEIMMMRDGETYSIGPHTDAPHKLVTIMYYLPDNDDNPDIGTSVFLPKDRSFRSMKSTHFDFALFDKVKTAPFVRNAMLGFVKTDYSWHGVESVTMKRPTDVRRILLVNIIDTGQAELRPEVVRSFEGRSALHLLQG
jgi:hypothetical protein